MAERIRGISCFAQGKVLERMAINLHPLRGWVSPLKGPEMDDSLKQMMHDLGNAINDSLSDSDRIAEAIGEIRRSGFDVFLVLEATIGFNRREDSDSNSSSDSDEQPTLVSAGKVRFTPQDERFLKALKITAPVD
jgi:hypothetical protein